MNANLIIFKTDSGASSKRCHFNLVNHFPEFSLDVAESCYGGSFCVIGADLLRTQHGNLNTHMGATFNPPKKRDLAKVQRI